MQVTMATAHLVSVDEYLHTSFEHDAEYVDGRIVERPLPQKSHSKMQGWLGRALYQVAHPLGFEIWTEQRIRTRKDPSRYRVPDVCVTLGEPDEQVFTAPPFLCIEILSPEDSALELQTKVKEYLRLGVSYIWVIDPESKTGEIYEQGGSARISAGQFEAGEIRVDITAC